MYSCNTHTHTCIITRDSLCNEVPCFRLDLLQHGVIQLSNNILVPYSEVDHQTKVVHLWSGRVCVCVVPVKVVYTCSCMAKCILQTSFRFQEL